MSLTVYPTSDYNSWISYVDACRYFDSHLDSDTWHSAHQTLREAALITAFHQLQELGVDLSDLRNEISYEKADGSTTTPKAELVNALKRGQCEQALHILRNGIVSSEVNRISLGGMLSVAFDKGETSPGDYSERCLAVLHSYIVVKTISKVR